MLYPSSLHLSVCTNLTCRTNYNSEVIFKPGLVTAQSPGKVCHMSSSSFSCKANKLVNHTEENSSDSKAPNNLRGQTDVQISCLQNSPSLHVASQCQFSLPHGRGLAYVSVWTPHQKVPAPYGRFAKDTRSGRGNRRILTFQQLAFT